jgi:hypothetical protein
MLFQARPLLSTTIAKSTTMAKSKQESASQRDRIFSLAAAGLGWKKDNSAINNNLPVYSVATAEKTSFDTYVGISFFKSSDEIHILDIDRDGLFAGSDLKIGQKVLAINGQECSNAVEDVEILLGNAQGPLTIVAVGEGIKGSKLNQEGGAEAPKANFWRSFMGNYKGKEGSPTVQAENPESPPSPKPGTLQALYDNNDDLRSESPSLDSDNYETPDRAPIPERLVDYFCVIGPKLQVEKSNLRNPSDLQFDAKLVDCYPESREDMAFPDYLPMFCFPNGYRLQPKKKEPTMSTFMLTSGAGHRLYGSALYMCEALPLTDLCELFWSSNLQLPPWLEEGTFGEKLPRFFLPKCLVVLSHHAFYSIQTVFLQQLLRISQTRRAPLPLERYVANFVHDVPLPKPGRTKVRWNAFTKDTTVSFARRASNELPLVNFSYQPLFRALSVSNILVLWGELLQEGRVVLRSEHMALLTPVAEGLMSLLFPLTWQGIYIPVLPSHMLDVLDAPVPFLVGLVGNTCPQPDGVIVCDLDQDVVQLGYDTNHKPQPLPVLPRKLATRLKAEIEAVADPLYLIPPTGVKGRITTAAFELLENSKREPYAHMTRLREVSMDNTHRQFILAAAEFIQKPKPLTPEDFHFGGQGEIFVNAPECEDAYADKNDVDNTMPPHMVRSDEESDDENDGLVRQLSDIYMAESNLRLPNSKRDTQGPVKWKKRAIQDRTDHALSFIGVGYATPSPYVVVESDEEMEKKKHGIAKGFYDLDEDLAEKTRSTFLRFFSSLLSRYKPFADGRHFRHEDFLNDLKDLSGGSRKCVEAIIKSQMFERFLYECADRRKLFDELVLLQQTSKSTKGPAMLSKQKEKHEEEEVSFLNMLPQVTYDIVPAAPCHIGVGVGRAFTYEGFPKLDPEELIANNTLDPISAVCHGTLCSPTWWFGED